MCFAVRVLFHNLSAAELNLHVEKVNQWICIDDKVSRRSRMRAHADEKLF